MLHNFWTKFENCGHSGVKGSPLKFRELWLCSAGISKFYRIKELTSAGFLIRIPLINVVSIIPATFSISNHSDINCFTWQKSNYECWVCWLYFFLLFWWKKVVKHQIFSKMWAEFQQEKQLMCAFIEISLLLLEFKNGLASETFKLTIFIF